MNNFSEEKEYRIPAKSDKDWDKLGRQYLVLRIRLNRRIEAVFGSVGIAVGSLAGTWIAMGYSGWGICGSVLAFLLLIVCLLSSKKATDDIIELAKGGYDE